MFLQNEAVFCSVSHNTSAMRVRPKKRAGLKMRARPKRVRRFGQIRCFEGRGCCEAVSHNTPNKDESEKSADAQRCAPDYCATQPPSIGSATPVIVEALSEHRNTARSPMASGLMSSLMAEFLSIISFITCSGVMPWFFA